METNITLTRFDIKNVIYYLPLLLTIIITIIYISFNIIFFGIEDDFSIHEKLIDLISGSTNVTFSFIWLIIITSLYKRIRIYFTLIIGVIFFYFSQLQDLLDEFIAGPAWTSLIENIGLPIGMIFISLGLMFWLMYQKQLINEVIRAKEKYKQMSILDELTGLHNSRHLNEILPQEIYRAKRYNKKLALLVIDLDNFKDYNDQYGHLEGDKVIRRFGKILQKQLREIDTAFRYGGEEFIVVLPESDKEQAFKTADRIRIIFAKEEFIPYNQVLHCTMSTGIAEYRENDDFESILHRADLAMYQAKKEGKNRICCTEN
ncbi:MAG: GGDEF domain-containing protein [Spirochaetes bacterium]|nr:GGDEF domain-containing protein [Spirochaetota bacterium]